MKFFQATPTNLVSVPFFAGRIEAGFPSPADDYLDGNLDINEHLIRNPSSTFLCRCKGDSMIGAGIYHDDILVIDKSLKAKSGDVIIAILDGAFTIKRFLKNGNNIVLQPSNANYPPLDVSNRSDFEIWGKVTFVLHKV